MEGTQSHVVPPRKLPSQESNKSLKCQHNSTAADPDPAAEVAIAISYHIVSPTRLQLREPQLVDVVGTVGLRARRALAVSALRGKCPSRVDGIGCRRSRQTNDRGDDGNRKGFRNTKIRTPRNGDRGFDAAFFENNGVFASQHGDENFTVKQRYCRCRWGRRGLSKRHTRSVTAAVIREGAYGDFECFV